MRLELQTGSVVHSQEDWTREKTIEVGPGCSGWVLVLDACSRRWGHELLGCMALIAFGLLALGGKVQREETQARASQSKAL